MRAGDFNRRSLTWIFDSHYVHVQSVTHQSWTSWWGDESGCNIPLSYSCDIWLERREDVWDGVGSAGGCWPTKSSRLIWQQWAETCPSNVFTNKLAGLLGVLWLGYGLSFYSCKCKVWIDSKCVNPNPRMATSKMASVQSNKSDERSRWKRIDIQAPDWTTRNQPKRSRNETEMKPKRNRKQIGTDSILRNQYFFLISCLSFG